MGTMSARRPMHRWSNASQFRGSRRKRRHAGCAEHGPDRARPAMHRAAGRGRRELAGIGRTAIRSNASGANSAFRDSAAAMPDAFARGPAHRMADCEHIRGVSRFRPEKKFFRPVGAATTPSHKRSSAQAQAPTARRNCMQALRAEIAGPPHIVLESC